MGLRPTLPQASAAGVGPAVESGQECGRTPCSGSPACWLTGSHALTERDLLPEGCRTSAARCGCNGAGTAETAGHACGDVAWRSRRRDSASGGERPRVVEVCWRCWRGQAAGGHGRRGGVPGCLTGQRRLVRAVEEDVVRFRLPALLPFDFEPGGVHRSNQAEVVF